MCRCPHGYHEAFDEIRKLSKAHPDLKIEEKVRKATDILFKQIEESDQEIWDLKERLKCSVAKSPVS